MHKILFVENERAGKSYVFVPYVRGSYSDNEEKTIALAEAKAKVIQFAKRHYPNLIADRPDRFNDPIDTDLFTQPEVHFCRGVEHKIDRSHHVLPTRAMTMEYASLGVPLPGVICPYTRLHGTSVTDYQLQDEIYLFVLRRMGVIPMTRPPSSLFLNTQALASYIESRGALCEDSSVEQICPPSPRRSLQTIGGLLSELINRIDGYYPNPIHDLEHDERCQFCQDGLTRIQYYERANISNAEIHNQILSLPQDLQSALCYKIWQRRQDHTKIGDPEWGKRHLLTNLHKTLSALREMLREHLSRPRTPPATSSTSWTSPPTSPRN